MRKKGLETEGMIGEEEGKERRMKKRRGKGFWQEMRMGEMRGKGLEMKGLVGDEGVRRENNQNER
jgi:hypothetical protein